MDVSAAKDLILDRDDEGGRHVSVPWTVKVYPVDAPDWGKADHACAELALNVLDWLAPADEPRIAVPSGSCSATAWRLHRRFMHEVLVPLPRSGACLTEARLHAWLERFQRPKRPEE